MQPPSSSWTVVRLPEVKYKSPSLLLVFVPIHLHYIFPRMSMYLRVSTNFLAIQKLPTLIVPGMETASKAVKHTSKTSKPREQKSSKPSKPSKSDKSGKSDKSRKSDKHSKKSNRDSLLDLWCAIYNPHMGNYYHWAFVVSNPAEKKESERWHIFEVTQERGEGPFTPQYRRKNPLSSTRCHRPLVTLGQMHSGWWNPMLEAIRQIPVGEPVFWNCQDYVLEIWETLAEHGMISHETWEEGKNLMIPYYGQDFGERGANEGYSFEDQDEDPGEGSSRVLSDEYVYDSDA